MIGWTGQHVCCYKLPHQENRAQNECGHAHGEGRDQQGAKTAVSDERQAVGRDSEHLLARNPLTDQARAIALISRAHLQVVKIPGNGINFGYTGAGGTHHGLTNQHQGGFAAYWTQVGIGGGTVHVGSLAHGFYMDSKAQSEH